MQLLVFRRLSGSTCCDVRMCCYIFKLPGYLDWPQTVTTDCIFISPESPPVVIISRIFNDVSAIHAQTSITWSWFVYSVTVFCKNHVQIASRISGLWHRIRQEIYHLHMCYTRFYINKIKRAH